MPSLISKDQKENIICTTDDVRGDVLGPRHGTTPAAVIANKIKLRSFKSSEHINKKGDGPYRGFGYLSLFILLNWGPDTNTCKIGPSTALTKA